MMNVNSLQNSALGQAVSDTGIYTDLTGLQKIKQLNNESGEKSEEALKAIAKQFESVFINMMMKSMRDANEAFKDPEMGSSNEMDFYQQMFDQQLALTISNRGVGIADAMVRQLSQSAKGSATELTPTAINPFGDYRVNIKPKADSVAASGQEIGSDLSVSAVSTFTDQQDFIAQMMPLAKRAADQLGIDPKYLLSQAALETGWGQHLIRDNQGRNSFNLFGIKANEGWSGAVATVNTLEYRDAMPVQERANFRAYSSYAESFEDYVSFISQQGRYSQALQAAENPQQYLQELQQAGYATDPDYAKKIINIANSSSFTADNDQG